jgi:hypothetical protein
MARGACRRSGIARAGAWLNILNLTGKLPRLWEKPSAPFC